MSDLGPDPMCPDCDHAVLHHQIDLAYARIKILQERDQESKRAALEAKALIALLRVQLDEEHQAFLAEQVATADALRELHEHDPQSCDQCSGHPLDAPRS